MCYRASVLLGLAAAVGCRPAGHSAADEPAVKEAAASGAASAAPRGADHGEPESRPANHLAGETSPYLLLHAHNPVDWYPWGEAAFEKAKREGKLVFLSIGYSSCYWCHVMARESFSNEAIAKFLNQYFVAIKVDREERPDVDEIYMTALQVYLQAVGSPQGGGWPLSMFLTPEAEPIMGGTYFPPNDREGMVGLMTVLRHLQTAWDERRQSLEKSAGQLAKIVNRQLRGHAGERVALDRRLVEGVLDALEDQYDPRFGGFGYHAVNPRYPKFPQPSNLVYLLSRAGHGKEGDAGADSARAMLLGTLDRMARGGIRDHLGGGFHRYSTDRFWEIPHFEKMLYDNAQLAGIYSEAYRLTGRADYRRLVRQLVAFVLREMRSPEGGFYSALDAETDGHEGLYYAWDRDELERLLDGPQFALLAEVYGVGEHPNFENHYVLLLRRPPAEVAAEHGWEEAELQRRLDPIRAKLLQARQKRQRPEIDTKILCAWNGLLIRGLADAGRILDEPSYREAARDAAEFLLANLRTDDGRLLRTYGAGRAKLNAYLDDYAFLADGLIALHQATGRRQWLDRAARLTDKQIELFWDDEQGGFYFTSRDHQALIARSKDPADSALPSGNAVSVSNLLYLAEQLDQPAYRRRAEETLRTFAPLLKRSPAAMPRMAVGLATWLDGQPAEAPAK